MNFHCSLLLLDERVRSFSRLFVCFKTFSSNFVVAVTCCFNRNQKKMGEVPSENTPDQNIGRTWFY